jgi:hypothetical protein
MKIEFSQIENKQTNKQTNKQNSQTNKQTNEQTMSFCVRANCDDDLV